MSSEDKEKRRKENIAEYFDVGKKYNSFKDLVNNLFPHSLELYGPTSFSRENVRQSLKDRRIYCGKFTNFYFRDSNYEYLKVNNTVELINKAESELSFYEQYNTLLAYYSEEDISEVLGVVENNLPNDEIKKIWLANYLKNRFSTFSTRSGFVSLSARDRAANIISIILASKNLFNYS